MSSITRKSRALRITDIKGSSLREHKSANKQQSFDFVSKLGQQFLFWRAEIILWIIHCVIIKLVSNSEDFELVFCLFDLKEMKITTEHNSGLRFETLALPFSKIWFWRMLISSFGWFWRLVVLEQLVQTPVHLHISSGGVERSENLKNHKTIV